MADEFTYRPQAVNYLGFLETQLRDLQGISALAYELIQNADDVKGPSGEAGSSRIDFDVQDEALVVENDGVFRPVDFERLQTIAGGGKRAEAGTIGAFGIGFLAVYQVTDRPQIFSGGRHWTIRPDAAPGERIQERAVETAGTRLYLPWATDPQSEVRRALRLPAVQPGALDEVAASLARVAPLAALFLHQLETITVRRAGRIIRQLRRVEVDLPQPAARQLQLHDEKGHREEWLLLVGDFAETASTLRAAHAQIEAGRESRIQLAIPLQAALDQGRIFAGLPTESVSPLPFHLNAGFYPTSDRRRIHLADGYQAAWNRAALRAAATLLAANLDLLRRRLDPAGFWHLLQQVAYAQEQAARRELPPDFARFWEAIVPFFQKEPLLYTAQEEWILPAAGRVPARPLSEKEAALLGEIGIRLPHPALAASYPLLRRPEVGVPPLALADLVEGLQQLGLDRAQPLHEAPRFLANLEALHLLWRLLGRLVDAYARPEAQEQERQLLNRVALLLDDMMSLQPPNRVFRGNEEARALFPEVTWVHPQVPEREFPGRLVADFGARQAVERLAEIPLERLEESWRLGRLDLPRLFRWFEARQIEIFADDPALQREIQRLPLCPVEGSLRPLAHLYIPGGFQDPLGLAAAVPVAALGGRRQFLEDLGVEALDFDTYVRRELPRALAKAAELPSDARHRLLRLLAERLGEIRDDDALQAQLSRLPLIPCLDGSFRAGQETYATREALTLLGEGTHIAEPAPTQAVTALYHWLGVRREPAVADLVRRLAALGTRAGARPVDAATLAVVEACWQRLQTALAQDRLQPAALAPLRAQAVIPTGERLARPDRLFFADAPTVAALFPDLEGHLLNPEAETARVWQVAGVRPLSTAAGVEILTPDEEEPAPDLQARITGRANLVGRILQAEGTEGSGVALLERLRVRVAPSLQVRYRLQSGGEELISAAEPVPAVLDPETPLLYVTKGETAPWLAIARALARRLGRSPGGGGMALAIREVLAAESERTAGHLLDELGYPP